MKKSGVYTRTGDKGTTGLIGGTRVSKTDVRLEAYGTVDEFNSQLGVLVTYLNDECDRAFVLAIQHKLFSVGSYLATDQEVTSLRDVSLISKAHIEEVEKEIDRLDEQLPPLRAFVIPGGGRAAALCHVCRAVCRRTERRMSAAAEHYFVSPEVMTFINRISDYLFILSRKLNVQDNIEEIFWDNTWK